MYVTCSSKAWCCLSYTAELGQSGSVGWAAGFVASEMQTQLYLLLFLVRPVHVSQQCVLQALLAKLRPGIRLP